LFFVFEIWVILEVFSLFLHDKLRNFKADQIRHRNSQANKQTFFYPIIIVNYLFSIESDIGQQTKN